MSAKKVRTRTSYITISSSSDSDDEPVRFVPNAPVVVKDDEEDELSILEVIGAVFQFTVVFTAPYTLSTEYLWNS